jgi:hypothetical protein
VENKTKQIRNSFPMLSLSKSARRRSVEQYRSKIISTLFVSSRPKKVAKGSLFHNCERCADQERAINSELSGKWQDVLGQCWEHSHQG